VCDAVLNCRRWRRRRLRHCSWQRTANN